MIKRPEMDKFEILDYSTLDDRLAVPIGFLAELNRATSRQEILNTYSNWCHRIFSADRCSIAMLEEGSNVIVPIAAHGSRGTESGDRFSLDGTIADYVLKTRQVAFIPELENTASRGCVILSQRGFKSTAIAPVATDEHRYGVLSISFFNHVDKNNANFQILEPMGRCLATQLLLVDQIETLSQTASTDALTGAFNRHFFNSKIQSQWREWREDRNPFVFISIDVDHFKTINDQHGHLAGDEILKDLVLRLRSQTRETDQIIRMGGEEFGIFARGLSLKGACELSGRLARTVQEEPFQVGDQSLPVTISIGLSEPREQDTRLDEVLKRADLALYEAKHRGRNRIVAHTDSDLISV